MDAWGFSYQPGLNHDTLSHCFPSNLKEKKVFMFDTKVLSALLSQIRVSSCYFISSHLIPSSLKLEANYFTKMTQS